MKWDDLVDDYFDTHRMAPAPLKSINHTPELLENILCYFRTTGLVSNPLTGINVRFLERFRSDDAILIVASEEERSRVIAQRKLTKSELRLSSHRQGELGLSRILTAPEIIRYLHGGVDVYLGHAVYLYDSRDVFEVFRCREFYKWLVRCGATADYQVYTYN